MMRSLAALVAVPASLVLLTVSSPAFALLIWPDLTNSSVALEPPENGCQYVFLPASAADQLILYVTLRDVYEDPLAGWTVAATVSPQVGSVVCACESLSLEAVSGAAGDVQIDFGLLGGWGTLDLEIYAHHPPSGFGTQIGEVLVLEFTSTDQDATCAASGPAAGVIDLGIWAGGLYPSPYRRESDLNCDGTVNVIDFGCLASGFDEGCADE